jgi:hypothetical protein
MPNLKNCRAGFLLSLRPGEAAPFRDAEQAVPTLPAIALVAPWFLLKADG